MPWLGRNSLCRPGWPQTCSNPPVFACFVSHHTQTEVGWVFVVIVVVVVVLLISLLVVAVGLCFLCSS